MPSELKPIEVYGFDHPIDPILGGLCPFRETAFEDNVWKKREMDSGGCIPYWMGVCGARPYQMKTCYKYVFLMKKREQTWWYRLDKYFKNVLRVKPKEDEQ